MNLQTLKYELNSIYKYRIELHAHTSPASSCSEVTPKELLDTFKNVDYDAIVITNHFQHQGDKMTKKEYLDFYMKDFYEAKAYGEEIGIKIILGTEIRFTENSNDYLIFGVNPEMLSEIYDLLPFGVDNFRKIYKMENSLFIQAHPFRDGIKKVDPKILDGIEVYNLHPHHNGRVGQAALYAKENNFKVITAGTDFHHPNLGHEGLAALKAKFIPEDSFSLAELLKSNDYLYEAGRNNLIL